MSDRRNIISEDQWKVLMDTYKMISIHGESISMNDIATGVFKCL